MMTLQTTAHLLLAALLSFTPFANADYNKDEHIVLADCGIGNDPAHPEWASDFWISHYSGEVWTDGEETKANDWTVYGQVPWDGSYPWRENGVTVKMADGDVVTVSIHPNVNDPAQAGQMTHTYDDHALTCWSYHRGLAGVSGKCRSAYVCNHKDGPHPAANQDKTKIAISTTQDFAKLSGTLNAASVYDLLPYGDNGKCDESWKSTGGGCSIQFRCHGNLPGLTKAMKDTLKGLPDTAEIFKHDTITEELWDPCKKISAALECIGGYWEKKEYWTRLPQTMSIDVANAEGADAGALEYKIDCSGGPQCDICKGAKFGAGFVTFVAGVFSPVLGGLSGAINQEITGQCLVGGC